MKGRSIFTDIAIMLLFPAIGVGMFTDGVRTVQILGLLASGAVFGMYLSRVIVRLRAKKSSAGEPR